MLKQDEIKNNEQMTKDKNPKTNKKSIKNKTQMLGSRKIVEAPILGSIKFVEAPSFFFLYL